MATIIERDGGGGGDSGGGLIPIALIVGAVAAGVVGLYAFGTFDRGTAPPPSSINITTPAPIMPAPAAPSPAPSPAPSAPDAPSEPAPAAPPAQ